MADIKRVARMQRSGIRGMNCGKCRVSIIHKHLFGAAGETPDIDTGDDDAVVLSSSTDVSTQV